MSILLAGGIFAAIAMLLLFVWVVSLRTVVSTNDVHIIQSTKTTISYGKGQAAGNTYYAWPSWIPIFGVKAVRLPVSVFNLELESYEAYDKGRVPFVVDIMAFFRISDSNTAAQRVHSVPELTEQLKGILQGASRSILAKFEIENILEERAELGHKFTDAVKEQLKEWGVENVKAIELMDIRDSNGSNVIQNIMAKKKSVIDKESRIEVAKNQQAAQEAEIASKRQVALQTQEAEEQVGRRTAEKEKAVGISVQQSNQAVKEQEKITTQKQMEVNQVQQVRTAEIKKEVEIISAEQLKRTSVIKAEGQAAASIADAEGRAKTAVVDAQGRKQQTELVAQGNLTQAKLHAEGIEAEGKAKGAADTAINVATVAPQIELAKQIGENKGYQEYLVTIRKVEASQAVGIAQAEAVRAAEIKVIANTGNVQDGIKSVTDLLGTKGGTNIGAMMEALGQTETGAALLEKIGVAPKSTKGNGTGNHA